MGDQAEGATEGGGEPGVVPPPPPAAPDSVGAVVMNYWKEFNLEGQRAKLDENALKIADYQETALKNRRKLMESTRDFKKAKENKEELFQPLLKSYQEEVDNLTKRAKFSEGAFLGVFQQLYDAPDPVAVLTNTVEATNRVTELQAENRKLTQELEEFQAESGTLKNQQVTVRRLEERNRVLEAQLESKAADLISDKQRALEEESSRTLLILKERETFLLGQLEAANGTVAQLRKEQDAAHSEVFALKAAHEEERAARQAELDIMQTEVEAHEIRVQTLEREKEKALEQVKAAEEAAGGGASEEDLEAAHAEIESLRQMLWELQQQVKEADAMVATAQERAEVRMQEAAAEVERAEAAAAALRVDLAGRPTHEKCKELESQIKALKAVGYDWDGDSDPTEEGEALLENLLGRKNRQLEHERTTLKRQLAESQAAVAAAEARGAKADACVAEQGALIRQLEEDLASRGGGGDGGGKEEETGGWDCDTPTEEEAAMMRAAAGDVEAGRGAARSGGGDGSGETGGNQSVVKVLAGQRDRFKARSVELEEELRQMRQANLRQSSEVEQLKQDNLALYERIRYVQDYQGDRAAAGGAGVLRKYGREYEEGLNPFAEFSKRERERGIKDMKIYDRVTLSGSRFLLANKYTRAFLFFYTIMLHSLVFLVLWKMSAHSVQTISTLPTEEMCSRQRLLASAMAVFKSADADHNGVLDAHEFEHALEEEATGT